MKIVMVWNKTLRRGDVHKIDIGFWNTYYSLMQLGHEVHFYDTASPPEKGLSEVVDSFKPELIYCCMTGDKSLTPYEPWEDIQRETEKGRTKTFKEIGYNNIVHGMWHTNLDFYPRVSEKNIDISFCGIPNVERESFTNALINQQMPVEYRYGISHEDMCELFSRSKISLNFSKNMTLTPPRRQIKARLFEVPAGGALLCTEVITFTNSLELYEKCKYLLKNDNVRKRIAENGFNRFKKEHESKQRLPKVLNEIMNT